MWGHLNAFIPSNKTDRLLGSRNVSSLECSPNNLVELLVSCGPAGAAFAGKTVQSARIKVSSTRADMGFTQIETQPKADRNTYCFVAQTNSTCRYWQEWITNRYYVVILWPWVQPYPGHMSLGPIYNASLRVTAGAPQARSLKAESSRGGG